MPLFYIIQTILIITQHPRIIAWIKPGRERFSQAKMIEKPMKERNEESEKGYMWEMLVISVYLEWGIQLGLENGIEPQCTRPKRDSVQFSSAAQSCLTLCNPMTPSTPGLPVHHQLLEFTQTHIHRVGDAIQPSHPLSSPCPPAPNPYQHQSLFQWVNSSHEVAKVLEFQL